MVEWWLYFRRGMSHLICVCIHCLISWIRICDILSVVILFVLAQSTFEYLTQVIIHYRKKKVTDHWRNYISPLMWRCQWLELRMKDLQSQVSRYDRELAVLKHEKELQTKMIELDCSSSRSVPFSSHCCRKTMKRRSRKRTEEKINAALYVSTHTVLSYYGKHRVLLCTLYYKLP